MLSTVQGSGIAPFLFCRQTLAVLRRISSRSIPGDPHHREGGTGSIPQMKPVVLIDDLFIGCCAFTQIEQDSVFLFDNAIFNGEGVFDRVLKFNKVVVGDVLFVYVIGLY